MSDRVRSELDRMYSFWTEHRSELHAMPRRFASVQAGLPLAAEPDELVNEALCRFASYLSRATSSEDLDQRSARSRDLGYIYRAMEHLNTDHARRQNRVRVVPPDQITEMMDTAAPEAEEERSSSDHTRLGILIEVLRSRAEGPTPRSTCLTSQHIACWQAVLKGRGAQAELAKEWDVHPSRITQLKNSAHAKVCETVYVAGILGPPSGLDDPTLIRRCLDVYDSTAETHTYMTPGDRVRLSTAALAVTITEDHGQRVDRRRAAQLFLKRKDKKKLRERVAGDGDAGFEEFVTVFAEELHEAETLQTRAADVTSPNCVLVCTTHHPVRSDRVIWDVEMCHD